MSPATFEPALTDTMVSPGRNPETMTPQNMKNSSRRHLVRQPFIITSKPVTSGSALKTFSGARDTFFLTHPPMSRLHSLLRKKKKPDKCGFCHIVIVKDDTHSGVFYRVDSEEGESGTIHQVH